LLTRLINSHTPSRLSYKKQLHTPRHIHASANEPPCSSSSSKSTWQPVPQSCWAGCPSNKRDNILASLVPRADVEASSTMRELAAGLLCRPPFRLFISEHDVDLFAKSFPTPPSSGRLWGSHKTSCVYVVRELKEIFSCRPGFGRRVRQR
jgi:hypothetical protein